MGRGKHLLYHLTTRHKNILIIPWWEKAHVKEQPFHILLGKGSRYTLSHPTRKMGQTA